MKKRISLLSLCLGLFIAACTDSSGFEDLHVPCKFTHLIFM